MDKGNKWKTSIRVIERILDSMIQVIESFETNVFLVFKSVGSLVSLVKVSK